jgi:3',5'-cyclic AMP phosphodiesterase CpdA
MPELKLVVAGLNSTMRESHQAEDHYGYLGEAQLRWFADKLAPYRQEGWLRIAACITTSAVALSPMMRISGMPRLCNAGWDRAST